MSVKKILAFALVLALLLPFSACGDGEPGLLQGIVHIGPLQPVETPGETVTPDCAVYEARKIMVYDKSGKKLVAEVDIDCDARYRVELEPGTYTIDINHAGIDTADGLPKQVEITSGQTTRVDIDIDTGIR